HVHTFAGATLAPGARLVVARDATGGFDFGLGTADAVLLYDAGGVLVDSVAWPAGTAPAGTSYGRIPDGSGAFVTLHAPTPGAENVGGPAPECGNDVREVTEACDGTDVAPSCAELGFAGG